MSKKVKQVVAIAAAVAVPFVAPAVAGAIGLSGVVGTAIAGAGLGALVGGATSKYVQGGSFRQGMLPGAAMGGISSGIAAYMAAPSPQASGLNPPPLDTAGTIQPSTGALTGATTTEQSLMLSGATPGTTGTIQPSTGTLFGATPTEQSLMLSGYGPGVEAGYQPYIAESGMFAPTSSTATFAAGPQTASVLTGSGAAPVGAAPVGAAPAGAAPAGAATAAQPTFMEALKAQFTNPQNLAAGTVQLGVGLGSQYLASKSADKQQKEFLEQQSAATQEAQKLAERQQAEAERIRRVQESQAKLLMDESKYYDPEYFGIQRARRAQLAGTTAKRAGLRGLSGQRRLAEERRFDLATGRDVGSAFDQGYMTGVEGRLNTLQAGINAMPSAPTGIGDYSYANALGNIRQTYSDIEEQRNRQAQDFARMFGSFTGGAQSRAT